MRQFVGRAYAAVVGWMLRLSVGCCGRQLDAVVVGWMLRRLCAAARLFAALVVDLLASVRS